MPELLKPNNPYTLIFGKEPGQVVLRPEESTSIISSFEAEPPVHQIFMLTGIRGSGKQFS